MGLHRCTEPECPFVGQSTGRDCRCHKTDEQVLGERVASLLDFAKRVAEACSFPADDFQTAMRDEARKVIAKTETA